jgi:hypothetical protein
VRDDETAQTDGLNHAPETAAADQVGVGYTPSLVITIEVERSPRVTWNCDTERDFERVRRWLESNGQLEELVGRAILLSRDFLERLDEIADA